MNSKAPRLLLTRLVRQPRPAKFIASPFTRPVCAWTRSLRTSPLLQTLPRTRSLSTMTKKQEDHQTQAGNTDHKEEDQWKHREPYRIHQDDDEFDVKWEAQCHCGKVQYQLSRDKPLAAKYCHCTTCQRLHGAPFQWAAIFHKSDINFTHGHHDLAWYDPSNKDTSHHLPCKVSCGYCRSPIMDEGRNMILLFPPLIKGINTKEAREAFKPTCHMFYPQRVAEFRGDGIVKWKGLDNGSDMLDDDDNVLVKHEEGMESKDMDEKKRKHVEFGKDDEVKKVKKVENGD